MMLPVAYRVREVFPGSRFEVRVGRNVVARFERRFDLVGRWDRAWTVSLTDALRTPIATGRCTSRPNEPNAGLQISRADGSSLGTIEEGRIVDPNGAVVARIDRRGWFPRADLVLGTAAEAGRVTYPVFIAFGSGWDVRVGVSLVDAHLIAFV